MVSKNNRKLIEERNRDERQRFTLRKLNVGVVSLLVGIAFAAYGNQDVARADAQQSGSAASQVSAAADAQSIQQSAVTLAQPATQESAAPSAATQESAASQSAEPAQPTVNEATPAEKLLDQPVQQVTPQASEPTSQAEQAAPSQAPESAPAVEGDKGASASAAQPSDAQEPQAQPAPAQGSDAKEVPAQPASDQPSAGAVTVVDGQVLTPEEAAAREEALKILQESPYMAMVFAAQADQNVVNVSTDQQFYDALLGKDGQYKNVSTIVLENDISLVDPFKKYLAKDADAIKHSVGITPRNITITSAEGHRYGIDFDGYSFENYAPNTDTSVTYDNINLYGRAALTPIKNASEYVIKNVNFQGSQLIYNSKSKTTVNMEGTNHLATVNSYNNPVTGEEEKPLRTGAKDNDNSQQVIQLNQPGSSVNFLAGSNTTMTTVSGNVIQLPNKTSVTVDTGATVVLEPHSGNQIEYNKTFDFTSKTDSKAKYDLPAAHGIVAEGATITVQPNASLTINANQTGNEKYASGGILSRDSQITVGNGGTLAISSNGELANNNIQIATWKPSGNSETQSSLTTLDGGYGPVSLAGSSSITVDDGGTFSVSATNIGDKYNKSLIGIDGTGDVTVNPHATFRVSGDGGGKITGIQLSSKGGHFNATRPEEFSVNISQNTNPDKKLITNGTINFNLVKERLSGEGASADYSGAMKNIQVQYNAQGQPTVSAIEGTTIANEDAVTNAIKNTSADNLYFTMAGPDVKIVTGTPSLSYNKETLTGQVSVSEDNINHKISNQDVYISVQIVKPDGQTINVPAAVDNPYHKETMQFQAITDASGNFTVDLSKVADQIADGDSIKITAIKDFVEDSTTLPVKDIKKQPQSETNPAVPVTTPLTTIKGTLPDPSTGISNYPQPGKTIPNSLPEGTTVTYADPNAAKTSIGTATSGAPVMIPVLITYPDGSTLEKEIPVVVSEPSQIPLSPVTTPLTVNQGGELPNAETGISNTSQMPAGTTYAWKDGGPKTDTAGSKTGTVIVTFPAKPGEPAKTTEVQVSIDVNQANPTAGNTTTVDKGHVLTPDDAKNAIGNNADMPAGTKYTWTQVPDVNTPGEKTGVVTVTMPGKAPISVTVKVNVSNQDSGNGISVPKGHEMTTEDAKKALTKGSNTLPANNAEVSWVTPVDTKNVGETKGQVRIHIPGQPAESDQIIDVPVTVTQPDPTAGTTTTVDKGHVLTPDDAKNAIGNNADMPAGTTYTWTKLPSTNAEGVDLPGEVTVKMPDKDAVPVPVKVTVSNQTIGNGISVPKGQTLDESNARTALTNAGNNVPADVPVSWVAPVNTNNVGQTTGQVKVQYPGQPEQIIDVPVTVTQPDPAAGATTTVNKGHVLTPDDAEKAIGNVADMPAGTKYTWTQVPDVNTPGNEKSGVVTVTMPGKDPVPVTVKVNISDQDSGNGISVTKDHVMTDDDAKQALLNGGNKLPNDAEVHWVDKVDTSNVGTPTGQVRVQIPGQPDQIINVPVTVTPGQAGDAKNPGITLVGPMDPKNPQRQLNQTEMDAVKAKIKDANRTDKGEVTVDVKPDGSAIATFPDGSKKSFTPDQDIAWRPEPTPVGDTTKLTPAEKAAVAERVEDANPDLLKPGAKKVEVADDGTVMATFPNGTKLTIPGTDTVKAGQAATAKNPAITLVGTDGVTPEVMTTIKDAVKKANPSLDDPSANVKVDPDGTTTATFPDGSQKVFKPNLTIAEKPVLTPVGNQKALTPDEQAKVKEAIGKTNPDLTNITVNPNGTATATAPGSDGQAGKTVDFAAADTVTPGQAADFKYPDLTPVGKDGVTPEVAKAIETAVTTANPILKDPKAKVDVAPNGTVTATFPDGSQKIFTPAEVTAKKPELTPVGNTTNLTPDEKAAVAQKVKDANPDLIKPNDKVEVADDGTVTVTFPNGTKLPIPGTETVKDGQAKDAKNPNLTPVKDPADLKPADLQKVKDAIEAANPTTFTGPNAKVEVGTNKDGQPIIKATFPDGSQKEYPLNQAVAKKPELTSVGNTKNLTPDEKATVAQKVKDANPDLIKPNDKVEVADDGTVTVTFPNGTKLPIPGTETVVEGQASHAKNPDLTPVKDPADLKADDLQKVKDAIEAANPTTFTGPNAKVEVGTNKDGQPIITATFPDGSQKEYPLNQAVAKKPELTPVGNQAALTPDERAKVTDAIKKANPDLTNVMVTPDGTVTATAPNGSSVKFVPADTVKDGQAKDAKYPDLTPVKDPSQLKEADQNAVEAAIKKANPDVTDVKFETDKTTGMPIFIATFLDGSQKIFAPAEVTAKKPELTPVGNQAALTPDEQTKVADAVKTANPDLTNVMVTPDGTVTATAPNGSPVKFVPADTIKDGQAKDAQNPALTPVADPKDLTKDDKDAIETAIKTANPDVAKVEFGTDKDGQPVVTATYPDGSQKVFTADTAVATKPAVTPVGDIKHLTPGEKAAVEQKVKEANPALDDPKAKVEVADDGTVTATFPNGSKLSIPGTDTVKAGDANQAKNPVVTPVADPTSLTPAEAQKVKDAVEAANPTLKDPKAKVEVAPNGTVTATFPDGSQKIFDPVQTVAKKPALTPVGNPNSLTPAEIRNVVDAVKEANPALNDPKAKVEVAPDGTVTATYPDGSQATFEPADTVTPGQAASATNPMVTLVGDPTNLTPEEIAKVTTEVKRANPTVTAVGVTPNGTVIATFPDGSQKLFEPDKTVAKKPALTPVGNPNSLTPAEMRAVEAAVKDANPAFKTVTVSPDGTAIATYPDGRTVTFSPDNTVKVGQAAGAKLPAITLVDDPTNLTPEEIAKVTTEVKRANPTVTAVGVTPDGTVTVTFPDGSQKLFKSVETVAKKTDADRNAPRAKDVTVQAGTTPAPEDAIANAGDLPAGTKFEWKNQPDTTTPGENTAMVVVTYPDGSTEEVAVKITVVKKATVADQLTPKVTEVTAKPDQLPDPSAAVSNLKELPKGTTITWDDPAGSLEKIRQAAPGTKVEVPATVTYPDGSVDHIMIPITIPAAKPEAGAITTVPGQLPDPAEGITNLGDLPAGTVVKWQNAEEAQTMLDRAEPGSTIQLPAEVTYADGTHELVMINVRVQTDATMMTERGAEDSVTMTEANEMRAKTAEANGAAKAVTGATTAPTAPAAKAKQGTLPQTGEQQNRGSLIGLAGLGLLALIGLGRKKRNEKED